MKTYILLLLGFFGLISQAQNYQWVTTAGGMGLDRVQGMAVDANKNLIATGMYGGTVDFDSGPGTYTYTSANNTWDVFIEKFDSLGNLLWVKSIGGPSGNDLGTAVKTDASGNIYVVGGFEATVDFDPGSGVFNLVSAGGFGEVFILKLDASGNFVWAKRVGGSDTDFGSDITLDAAGNILVVGGFQTTVDFDPGPGTYTLTAPGTASTNNQHGFVLKLNSAGNFLWAEGIHGGGFSPARSVVTDASNNVYLCGNFNAVMDFDPGPGTYTLNTSGQSSSYVMKLSSAGGFVWAKSSGQGPNSVPNDLALDGLGNLYVAGNYGLSFDFGPGSTTLNTAGSTDMYIMKLDLTGNFIWAKSVGSPSGYDDATAIAVDAAGNSYITGYFGATGDFDPNAGISNLIFSGTTGTDVFVLKLNSAGDFVFGQALGATVNNNWAWDIALDNAHHIYTGGGFYGTVDFDLSAATHTATSNGGEDMFIQKLSQNVCSSMALSIVSTTNISCSSFNGNATAAVSGANGPVSYVWSNGTVLPTVTVPSAGIYSVTVTDALGCTRSSATLITGILFLNNFDVTANLVTPNFVPGLNSFLQIHATNNGCVPTAGKVKLVLDPSMQTFNASTPAPSQVSGDTLIWNYPAMSFGTTFTVPFISVKTNTAATIGDTICMPLIITPITGDANAANNQKQYCVPVVTSYDPNDKKVYPKGECTDAQILNNQLLTYTIRFQNTGTANAINIMVKDSLAATIDLSTVRVIGHSHPMVTEVAGRILKFQFANINLPDATSNEPLSHGYVIFEAKPVQGLPNNTLVKNSVGIYFDYNAPVLTNTVSNLVVTAIDCGDVGIEHIAGSKGFAVYPNPAVDKITVSLAHEAPALITFTDLVGKEVLRINSSSEHTEIDPSDLSQGVYMIRILQNGNTWMQKLVIRK